MSQTSIYQQHRRLYNQFYKFTTRKHPNTSQLASKFKALLTRLEKQEDSEEMYLLSVQPRRARDESPLNEMQSLRITSSSSKNALDVSRGKLSRRSDSSREPDKSQGEGRFFGMEWVYSSNDQSRVYVFAMLASFILNDNSVGFLKLQDRMNDELGESQSIPPILMISVNKYWQRVIEIVTKKKSYLWEKHLKQPLDRMPLDFVKLVARVVAGQEFPGGAFTREQIGCLIKEGKVAISNFVINCREIEQVDRQGAFSSEIIMGYLRHRKTYVIANKIPDYSENQTKHRKAKAVMQQGIRALLLEYHMDEQELALLQQSSVPNEKEKVVKDFLGKKLAALRQN